MAVTIQQLINTCPAPVADAAGVTSAITWCALSEAFAMEQKLEDMPNKHLIINTAEATFINTEIQTTDYAPINDGLMHVKTALQAIQTLNT